MDGADGAAVHLHTSVSAGGAGGYRVARFAAGDTREPGLRR